MEQPGSRRPDEQIINIARNDNVYHEEHTSRIEPQEPQWQEDQPLSGSEAVGYQNYVSSLRRTHSGNSLSMRRSEGYNHMHRSPFNFGLWIFVEFVIIMGQIIAAVVVLSLSIHERPKAPLFTWVVGYTSGCVATLPILYWRYYRLNQITEPDANQSHHAVSQSIISSEASTSVASAPSGENQYGMISASTNRGNDLVRFVKLCLDCFFAVWFIVGNMWIFRDHSASVDAPNLYRLCLVFLVFLFIGYAIPLMLCTTICCCLPCIISVLNIQEDVPQTRGATEEAINALPTYKFKLKGSYNYQDIKAGSGKDNTVAAGTEKEHVESDAAAVHVCCICLTDFEDEEELRELPCLHFYHVNCIDKWLKINASCPLCKYQIGTSNEAQP